MSNYYQRRMPGELKGLKGGIIPKRFLFFDTETTSPTKDQTIDGFKLILGSAIFVELDKELDIKRRETYSFHSTDEFINILESYVRKKSVLYVFAHNIGFDVRVLNLPYEFNNRAYTSQPPIINENAFIWRVRSNNGSFIFLDTRNLGVRSVESLGKDMGFPKMSIDFETCTREYLQEYCNNDSAILEKFVLTYIRYINVHNMGSFKPTLASQAMAAYRTRFMTKPPVIHSNPEALRMERQSYHGGRVECFKLGEQPHRNHFYLDVNSMYPFAMMGNDLPIRLVAISHRCTIPLVQMRMKDYYVIADVTINTNEAVYPYIKDTKLIFPIGIFRTILSHHELQYAIENNQVSKIHCSIQYEKGELFESYINFFYSEKTKYRLSFDKTHETISKLFLNSFYGKWGQQQPHRELMKKTDFKGVTRMPMYSVPLDLHFQEINWYGDIYNEWRQGETSFSCPVLASAITSKARMLLWMYVKQAGQENVLYVDTDSLIVTARGKNRLNRYCDETRLGSLKLEAQSQYFDIRGNKDYKFSSFNKHKGVPTKATKIDQNRWEYLEFEGFIRWMNRGAVGYPKGKFTTKTRKSEYNKGIVHSDKTITPFVLSLE